MKSLRVGYKLALQRFLVSKAQYIVCLVIREGTIAEVPKRGKGGKEKKKVVEHSSDFLVEYAKSGRAACRGCLEKIAKVDTIHINKT